MVKSGKTIKSNSGCRDEIECQNESPPGKTMKTKSNCRDDIECGNDSRP
ncbi:hypothetical protein OS242_09250 [Tumebacillus sp. DT12]|uniref:Uncharacterized protein n=1 Tax=Tumebacillus lacus TaxID=2995335 RepID=A0ABT3WZS3_9BACL|nr:hypothetical protein [Tumebacillus lacus]MCX7570149.1 hypothetical protein [Tumebacillus lacus]